MVTLQMILGLLLGGPSSAQAKYQVCSVTINSNDEIEAFKNFLPERDFEFHELSPITGSASAGVVEAARVRNHYLKPYCARKQRCDVLIISGHFGGTFTGTANFTLSLDDMNSLSCSSACDGIFGAPKEVFLFGCNTLAGKTKDSRTPREYVQVLIEHGYSANEARQISNLRYGPTGGTFIDSMQRVFNRTPKIYGFDSISPRGSTDAQFLKNYFKEMGDYKTHLDGIQMNSPTNALLKKAFRYSSFLETSGRDSSERSIMCDILDPALPTVKKVALFETAMNGEAPLTFIPSIQKAIRENRELKEHFQKRPQPNLASVFDKIKANASVKELIGKAFESLQLMLPTNAFDLMDFSEQMGWFSKQEIAEKKAKFYRERLQEASNESIATLCELRDYNVELKAGDLQAIINKPLELKKVSCLPVTDQISFFTAMTERWFSFVTTKNNVFAQAYQGWVLDTLMQRSALGKSFVDLYVQQPNEVFFHPLVIQKGIETNAFFYDRNSVLQSLQKRTAKDPSLGRYRSQFSALSE